MDIFSPRILRLDGITQSILLIDATKFFNPQSNPSPACLWWGKDAQQHTLGTAEGTAQRHISGQERAEGTASSDFTECEEEIREMNGNF